MWNVLFVALVHGARSLAAKEAHAEAKRQLDALEERRQAIIDGITAEHDLKSAEGLRAADEALSSITKEYEIAPASIAIWVDSGDEPETHSQGSQRIGLSFSLKAQVGTEFMPAETFEEEIRKHFLNAKLPESMGTIRVSDGRALIEVETRFVSDLAKAKAILEQTLQATSASLFAQISNHCATHNAGVQEQINVIRKQIFAIHNAKNIALGIQPKAYSPSDSKEKESRNLSYNKHDFRQVKTGFTIIAIAISLFVVISGIQLLRDPVAFITDVGQSLSGKKLIENEKWKEGWTQGRLDSYDIACINAAYKAQEPALLGMNDKEKKATATQIVSWCSCMSKLFAETFPYDDALRNESQNLKMLESSGETQRCRREADTAANAELAL